MYQHPLSNLELFDWLSSQSDTQSIFRGVYSRDTLPEREQGKPAVYIANTAPNSHPTVVHWTALLCGVETPEYFDSLGHKPCHEFTDLLGPEYTYCSSRLQSLSTYACGYHCLYYAVCRAQGVPFERIVHDLYNMDDQTVMQAVQRIHPIKIS